MSDVYARHLRPATLTPARDYLKVLPDGLIRDDQTTPGIAGLLRAACEPGNFWKTTPYTVLADVLRDEGAGTQDAFLGDAISLMWGAAPPDAFEFEVGAFVRDLSKFGTGLIRWGWAPASPTHLGFGPGDFDKTTFTLQLRLGRCYVGRQPGDSGPGGRYDWLPAHLDDTSDVGSGPFGRLGPELLTGDSPLWAQAGYVLWRSFLEFESRPRVGRPHPIGVAAQLLQNVVEAGFWGRETYTNFARQAGAVLDIADGRPVDAGVDLGRIVRELRTHATRTGDAHAAEVADRLVAPRVDFVTVNDE